MLKKITADICLNGNCLATERRHHKPNDEKIAAQCSAALSGRCA
jgi:hypothetical protein